MSKLKIGYWPLSDSLSSTGDRRRLVFWAKNRGHTITTDLSRKVDVIVASEGSDFNSKYFESGNTPIVFDLVDAYLSPQNVFEDLARGLLKQITGQITGNLKPFSRHIGNFCMKANAVVCSSVEQERLIKQYNINTHIILDSHDEIPLLAPGHDNLGMFPFRQLLWEGKPATLGGVNTIYSSLNEIAKVMPMGMRFVTDESYFMIANKYLNRKSSTILKNSSKQNMQQMKMVPWSIENLVTSAKESTLAIIPLDLTVPMQTLKPENRLLIMWRLGLPCLTSETPAYKRVAIEAGVEVVCQDSKHWLESISRFLSDSKYALNQVKSGQSYIQENHSRKIILEKWDHAINSALG
jgi:hypothetical protein